MGIFDWVLKSIGFEVDDPNKPKKQKKSKKTATASNSSLQSKFNLSNPAPKTTEVEEKKPGIVESENLSVQAEIGKNIAVFAPITLDELGGIVDFTRKRLAAIVNLSNLTNTDHDKALDFLNGAMYAMRGQVSQLDSRLYLVAPQGTATITEGK